MKIKIILMVLSFAILFACNPKNNRSFLPGIYVNNAAGKYSVASDTLVIEAVEGNRFELNRKTGFNLIRDGKKGKREYETEKWNPVYDEETGVLTESRRGKTLTFYPDSNVLKIGSRSYQKVN
ncbi:hypothetical protein ACFOG5_19475 [Pedobacter fastidiosus]|uniref:MORN repeat variant n=1 Tax=Pedobacter fastidiosus TaxID=2765361 RepID=A0ABR7KXS3_9SPHI|nr:hypothetical protein [Pedobacter fastidiosus]MBC6112813.1 hypothetical protein [Pedobacter fastidiosus]